MNVYIVTKYGCNSTPSDMWTPVSKLFSNYEEAYEHFLIVSPPIDRECEYYEEADHCVNTSYDPESANDGCTFIENRCQKARGNKDCSYAKRPYGAVIARYRM
jgi:hypothetical protein